MSHVRPNDKIARHRRSDCRKGRHQYGESQNIGAGIVRRVCEVCAYVTIDLTSADELETPLVRKQGSVSSTVAQQSETSRTT